MDGGTGPGTTIRVYLPRLAQAPPEVEATDEMIPSDARGQSVLVVEDEDLVRDIATLVLRKQGYNVVEAKMERKPWHISERLGQGA